MKRSALLSFAFICVAHFATAQTIGFQRTYGGINDQQADAVKQTFDGGYIAAGYTYTTPYYNVWVVKTDIYGDTTWTRQFRGDNMVGFDVIQTRDSNFVVSGYRNTNGQGQLIKLSQSGDSLWERVYSNGQGWIQSVQEMYNGDLLCGGYTLFKVDANGNNPFPFPAPGQIEYVITTHDSGFAAVGFGTNIVTLRKYAQNGSISWSKSLPYQLINASNNDLLEMPDHGYVYVCSPSDFSTVLVRTNSNGDTLWTKHYPNLFYPSGVTHTTDGGFALAVCDHSTGVYDFELAKTDSAGVLQWTNTYGHGTDAYCNSVHQTSDGGFILAGSIDSSQTGNGYDLFLVKTDSLGSAFGTSIHEFVQQTDNAILFPVPAHDHATIRFDQALDHASITVTDIQGKIIRRMNDVSGNEYIIARDELQNGTYFILVTEDDHCLSVIKCIFE